jgi:zinc transport system substrate-binding protein
MRPIRLSGVLLLLAAALPAPGCGARGAPGDAAAEATKISVFAGIPPLAYLVQRIGGPWVEVGVLVAPGQNPHLFQPSPRQVVALKKAVLFFKIGMPFESRLVDLLESRHRRTTVVDAADGIAKRWLADECADEAAAPDGQAPREEHHAGGPDPHVWLTPRNLQIMAANIAAALEKAAPAHAADFRRNRAALADQLDLLDARIRRALRPFQGQTFYVFHPAFGYFADAYALRQQAVESEGKSPTPRQLLALIKQARAQGVKIIFLQPQFDRRSAAAVAEAIGGAVVTMDPLAPDVVKNLDDVAAKIRQAFPS